MSKFKPFLALKASAGSGKTFALSVRFIYLVLRGASLNEIVALTFTNKAANEMKTRIIQIFLELGTYDKQGNLKKQAELDALCELFFDENELSKQEQYAHILKLRDERKTEFLRSELKISTIDSFFARILRAFALNLGLMSDFKIEQNESQSQSHFIKSLDEKELKVLAKYAFYASFDEEVFSNLELLYQNNFLNDKNSNSIPIKIQDFPIDKFAKINQSYLELKELSEKLSKDKNLKTNFEFDTLDFKNIYSFCEKPVIQDTNKKYFKVLLENEDFVLKRTKLIQALDEYANAVEEFKINVLRYFLRHFKQSKDGVMKEQNVLSFTDVALKNFDLTQNDELKDLIYFRLDGYISHLLIDEFQDTSVLQYEILKPIIAEIVSGKGVRDFKSFFYVGDVKQSIYRFRNGRKELFYKLQEDFKQIQEDELEINYRSKENIVNFVNTIFKKAYKNNAYTEQLSLKDELNQGFVRVVQSVYQEQKSKSIQRVEASFSTLLEQLNFLRKKGLDENEICILCWKNSEADRIVEFLHQHNIKAYTQSNIALEKKASVCTLLTYAKYCLFAANANDKKFYLELLSSLLGRKIAENLPQLKLKLHQNPAHICLKLAKQLKLDLSDEALVQYLEYAASEENFLTLIFTQCPENIKNKEKLGINVMTVHKCKGLEFQSVILMDRLSKPANDMANIMLEYDFKQEGFELKIRDKIRAKTKENAYNAFISKAKELEKQDKLNQLYVALTRAKSNLVIIKNHPKYCDKLTPSLFAFFDETGKNYDLDAYPDSQSNLACIDIIIDEKTQAFERGTICVSEFKEQKSIIDEKQIQDFVEIDKQELVSEEHIDEKRMKEIYFGNAFHFFMQNLELLSGQNFEQVKQMCKNKFYHFLDTSSFERLSKLVKNLLENVKFKQLIQNKTLRKEQALSFNGQIKRIDLLGFDEKEAFVIDYKTGIKTNLTHALHQEQVQFYQKAIEHILQREKTSAFIIYLNEQEIQIQGLQS